MSSINIDLLNEFDLQQFISEQSQFYKFSSFLSLLLTPLMVSSIKSFSGFPPLDMINMKV